MMGPGLFREHRLIFFSPYTSPETPPRPDESEDESAEQRESVDKTVDEAELKSLYDKVQSLLTRAEERSRYLPEEGPRGSRAWEGYINEEVDAINTALEQNWVDAIADLTRLHSHLLRLNGWQDRQMDKMKQSYERYETGRRVEYRRGPLGCLRRRCVPYAHLVKVDPLAGRKGFDAHDLDPFPKTPPSEVRSDEPVPVTPVESQPAVQQDAEADRVLEDAEGLLHGIEIDDEESASRVESTISTINRVGSALWHLDRNDPRIPRLLAARDALNAALKEYRDSLLPPAKETAVPEEVDERPVEGPKEGGAAMEEPETVQEAAGEEGIEQDELLRYAESRADHVRSALAERIWDPKDRAKGRNAVSVELKDGRYILRVDLSGVSHCVSESVQTVIEELLPIRDTANMRYQNQDSRDGLPGVTDRDVFDALVQKLSAAIRVFNAAERAKYSSISPDGKWHDASEVRGGKAGWRYCIAPDGSMIGWDVGKGAVQHFSEQSQQWEKIIGSDLETWKYQSIPSDGNYYPADRIVGGTPGWRYRREGSAMYAMKDNTIRRYSFGEQGGKEWRTVR